MRFSRTWLWGIVIILLLETSALAFHSIIIVPQQQRIESVELQTRLFREKIRKTRSHTSDFNRLFERARAVKSDADKVEARVYGMEQKLLDRPALHALLNGEFFVSSERAAPDITVTVMDERRIDNVNHEIARVSWHGSYSQMLVYLDTLQKSSPFVKITSLKMSGSELQTDRTDAEIELEVLSKDGGDATVIAAEMPAADRGADPFSYFLKNRDPKAAASPDFDFKGIFFKGQERWALISGKRLKEREWFSKEIWIDEITKSGISISYQGQPFFLKV